MPSFTNKKRLGDTGICWLLILFAVACGLANPARAADDGLPRGCNEMPYTRYEAEAGSYGGGAILRSSPNFDPNNTASEASNQEYVGLPVNGSYVQWTVTQPAGGATVRFTLPDNATGTGVTGSLDVWINGTYATTINLGSYWAWTYFNGTDNPTNTPGTEPCMRFDELHFLLPGGLQPGDVLKIVKTNGDPYEYGIDFVETEAVPAPLGEPTGFVSVADYGATGTGTASASDAFDAAWQAAINANTGLYIPPGKYYLDRQWNLGDSSGIAIQGAGIWYTELFFSTVAIGGGGIIPGKNTNAIEISNIYMNTALNERYIVPGELSNYKAINGPLGSGSRIHDMWFAHFEGGVWVGDYTAPVNVTTGLDFVHNRVRYSYADGINLSQGTSACTVHQCDFRSCGDDAMAVWSSNSEGAPESYGNLFYNNTVEFTYRAGDAGIFGGYGHQVHHCIFKDGTYSAGIRLTEDFAGFLFKDNKGIYIFQNTVTARGTDSDIFFDPRGAIEISGTTIQNIFFDSNDILNSQYNAIDLNGGHELFFTNTTITTTGLDNYSPPTGGAVYEYGNNGNAEFVNLALSNIDRNPAINQTNSAYNITVGNSLVPSPYEMQISFTGYTAGEELPNFPVLVELGSSLTGASGQFISSTGADLRFRDAVHDELPYQIESWNPNGASYVWVQVPNLEAGGTIWADWGNPALATAPAYTTNGSVWSQGYAAIYHANQGGGTNYDSTANARNGTPIGSTTGTTGFPAGGDAFNGRGSAVELPANFGLFTGTENVTVEFWFNANAVAPSSNWATSPVLFQARGENSWMITFGDSSNGNVLHPRVDQGGAWVTPVADTAPIIQTGQWYYYAATYTSSGTNNWQVYLNGASVSQGTQTGTVASENDLHDLFGGDDETDQGASRFFNGSMDEVRVSSVARDPNWIWASWNTVYSNDTFATYGQPQSFPASCTFSVASGTGGCVTGYDSGAYTPGSTVTVEAVASPYYTFGRWTGDVSSAQTTQNPLILTMDQNRSVTAVFEPNLAANGVPEWWLAQYGWITNFNTYAGIDADGTGQTNLFKYVAGLNPLDPSSRFVVNVQPVPGQAGQAEIVFSPMAIGRTYTVASTNSLTSTNWVTLTGTTETDNGQQSTVTDLNASGPVKFYRVQISAP